MVHTIKLNQSDSPQHSNLIIHSSKAAGIEWQLKGNAVWPVLRGVHVQTGLFKYAFSCT